jgi:hypothetical protein
VAESAEAGVPALALLGAGAGLDATLQALTGGPEGWRIVLCTPGSPADQALVAAWAARGGRHVEHVPMSPDATPAQRLGGLVRAAAGDVVVLAPGAVPAPGSLEGMARALRDAPGAASATAWSNDGELVAFPRIGECQPLPEDLAAVAARLDRGQGDALVPIGGCHAVALSGQGLAAVGGLDATSYFSTYAMLVDLYLRQSAFGWRHLLATRCYVGARQEQGPGMGDMQQLTARYPDYGRLVAEFLMRDPLRDLRAQLASAPVVGPLSPATPSPQGDLFG